MKDNHPLVSVVVITYNSKSFLATTLDSVKQQTYDNIELIVSDDCSTDGTIFYIKSWLNENAKYFYHAALVESPINTGTAPNINRGINKASGKWIKLLSGDDKLLQNSITDYVKFINANPQCNICFGKLKFFGEDQLQVNFFRAHYESAYYPYLQGDYSVQWRRIQEELFVPGPGLFYKKQLWEKVNGLDDRFPFADEYPFTYNVLESGERIYFLDKEVYGYHIRNGSLYKKDSGILDKRVFNDQYNYIKKSHVFKMIKHGYPFIALHVLLTYFRQSLMNINTTSFVSRGSFLLFFFSPYSYRIILKRIKILIKERR